MQTLDAEALKQLDRTVVWHAFSQMQSYDGLIIESADGCWLNDIEGRAILDGASSLWCNLHGHRHPHIDQAIRDQLDQVAHVTNLGMSHPTTIKLAKRLIDSAPQGLEHVFFCSDGASAVEVAIKMAYQYWQLKGEPKRTKFIALGQAYHGDTIGTVALGGVPAFHDLFRPLLFPVLRGPCPDVCADGQRVAIYPTTHSELLATYIDAYQALADEHCDEIAAIVIEPILQCAAGMVLQPSGFLRALAEICHGAGALLIVDEIAVGMGRTGRLYACQYEEVRPDILCLGKGLTGGYLPMSATLASARVFDAFLGDASKTLYHGHTYGGNPLGAAAAHASLDLLESTLLSPDFASRISQLENRLKKIANLDDVRSVRQIGLLGAIELRDQTQAKQVCARCLERNVWLRPLGKTVPLVPPLAISEAELGLLLDALEYGVDPTGKVL